MSARSVALSLKNETRYDLLLDSGNVVLNHGEFTTYPPSIIKAGQTGRWQSDSDGFMTGTEGHLGYFIQNGEGNRNWVYIYWDDPYSGSNAQGSDLADKVHFSIRCVSGIGGNNANMDFVLSETATQQPWAMRAGTRVAPKA